MSLHHTNFSPLDHGTIAKRRDPLLVDMAKAVALLPAVAALTVYAIARECWRDVLHLATGKRPKP